MRRPMLSVVYALLLLASGTGIATTAAQTPAATGSGDRVVLNVAQRSGTQALRFVNPASGRTWDWPLKQGEYLTGAVAGSSGMVFAGIVNGRSTGIYAVDARFLDGDVSPQRIASVPGRSMVWKRSADGAHLLVLTFSAKAGEPPGLPTRLTSVAIPAAMRAAGVATDDGAAVGAPLVWYALVQPAGQPPSPTSRHLWRATLREGQKPVVRDTGAKSSGYYSVLQAPDGHAVYLIDFFNQKISVIDPAGADVVRSITFGDHAFKRPQCGAAISADGDRLYVLSNLNNTTSSGYLVYDTRSWRRLAHPPNPPGTTRCIGVSPDGQSLFITSDQALVTLDAATGQEIDRMTFGDVAASPDLVLATSAGG